MKMNDEIAQNALETQVKLTVLHPYSAPQVFIGGSTVKLIQGNGGVHIRDAFNRWYARTF